ncbi:hypothetical protein GCM10010393_42240 [Streptomyces gobitricini]|uniref:Transposase n=1 Tax=Streptomyces gobitricini TaxID=68211 RepID=A0ABP5ZV73_9ACTN
MTALEGSPAATCARTVPARFRRWTAALISRDDRVLVEKLFKGFVAVLATVCHLGCGDRQGPEDAGMAVR